MAETGAPSGKGRSVTVAVWQGSAATASVDANLAVVRREVEAAARRGVELILFPELFLSGYDCTNAQLRGGAAVELETSPAMASVRELARRFGIAIALPYAETYGDHLYNSCALFDKDGRLVLNYRKVNLWGPWEQSVFTRGSPSCLTVAQLPVSSGISICIGACICYDIEFPEPARSLAVQGAEVLLVPTALGAGAVDSTTPFQTVPARAMENHVFVMYSNLEGKASHGAPAEQNLATFCGRSAVVAPDGGDIVRAGLLTGGMLLCAELRLDGYSACVERNPYLQDRARRLQEGHYSPLMAESLSPAKAPALGSASWGQQRPVEGPLDVAASEAVVRGYVEGLERTEYVYGEEHPQAQWLHLYLPDSDCRWLAGDPSQGGRMPVAVIIHGGFWKDKWHAYNTVTTCLVPDFLSRGFAVALLEYRRRGMPGGTFPGPEDDCLAALRFLTAHVAAEQPIDPSRLLVLGHSAGGHLALAVCGKAEAAAEAGGSSPGEGLVLPSMCVAVAPVADMLAGYSARLSDEGDAVERYLGGLHPDTDEGRRVYREASLTGAASRRPKAVPTLLVAGGLDTDVPAALVTDFHLSWAAEDADCPAELLLLPLADHYDVITAGKQAWAAVARRLTAMLQTQGGWRLPPHLPDYGVSRSRGFLPQDDPAECLQPPSNDDEDSSATAALFREWEECASQLPSILCAGSGVRKLLRARLSATPTAHPNREQDVTLGLCSWQDVLLADPSQAERAMLLLSFIAHAWVWGEKPTAVSLPPCIAVPWVAVADIVGRPPILTYFSFNACNWRRLDAGLPVELGNTCRALNFLGGQDEEWFSAVHVAIEARAGEALAACVEAQRALSGLDPLIVEAEGANACWAEVAGRLERVAAAIQEMISILKRMKEGCDPYIYYMRVRLFMSGWTHEDLPDGMVYEGVPALLPEEAEVSPPPHKLSWRRERYFGETGAQSSVIPALDAALGVAMSEDELSPYLMAMRKYMPPQHADFIAAVGKGPSIRSAVISAASLPAGRHGARAAVEAYNGCLNGLTEFRSTHLELAYSFVRKFDERKDEDIRGTGGTPFMPYLKKHWRSTSQLVVKIDEQRLNGGP